MNSIYDFTDISDFVASTFQERQIRNQSYSLGSFARDLGISKSILSGVIAGKKGLRLITLNKIIKIKKLNSAEEEYLKCIWMLNFSKSKTLRERAKKRIKVLLAYQVHLHVKTDSFNPLQEWYILPVFEMICNNHAIEEIARSLGIKNDLIKKTIRLLIDNNYLKVAGDGRYEKFQNHIKFESPISADHIKNYHKNFLKLSTKKISTVSQEKRKFLTSTLTISSEDILQARNELESFLFNFINKYSNAKNANEVYSFALQFYPLIEEEAPHA